MTTLRIFPTIPRKYISGLLRFSGAAVLAVSLTLATPAPWGAGTVAWAAGATLDRPLFDRKTVTINVPFKGTVPVYSIAYLNNATRLNIDFATSKAKAGTPYKLSVYHELLSQVEMLPEGDRVRVSILTARAAKVKVDADLRHGQLRLVLEEVDMMEGARLAGLTAASEKPVVPTAAPFTVANGPPPKRLPTGNGANFPDGPTTGAPAATPVATPGPLPPNGLVVLAPSPPPIAPAMVMASAPPIRPAGQRTTGVPLPGTPASGSYVYRKAVPTGSQDVTEVQVRTGTRAEIDVAHDPRAQSVLVNVVRPNAPSEPVRRAADWTPATGGASSDAWRLPGPRRDLTFRPMAALDGVVGYALMLNESAPALGSEFSGQGATTYGFDGHLPLGQAFNLSLGMEGLGYTVSSPQVKDASGADAQTRRDELIGRAQLEYLAVRSPWVFAIGPGYWARYMMNKTGTLLPPPTPSIVLGPNQLFHGPALQMRVYYPLWDALGIAAEGGASPYMSGGGDAVASRMGTMYGYQGAFAMKWGNRYVSLSAGYRHQGFGSFSGGYTFSRGGPEASFVWRF
jgi:hypothetical protein